MDGAWCQYLHCRADVGVFFHVITSITHCTVTLQRDKPSHLFVDVCFCFISSSVIFPFAQLISSCVIGEQYQCLTFVLWNSSWVNTLSYVTHYSQVGVVGGFAQTKLLLLVRSHSLQHAVEDVIVSLIMSLQSERKKRVERSKLLIKNVQRFNCPIGV